VEILIISKTRKGKSACVGGIIIETNESVRLLNTGNWDQYADTELKIGDIWDIKFVKRQDILPPHIEDVIISDKKFIKSVDNITDFIQTKGITTYKGSPLSIFDGKIKWSLNGSGYIADKTNLPPYSTGFWISDKNLDFNGKHYIYNYNEEKDVKLPFVGFIHPIKTIPAGVLIRFSLARWWKPEDVEIEQRCYLQLSGWYDYNEVY
jgi:putative nucleic acid modification protein with dual OB domain